MPYEILLTERRCGESSDVVYVKPPESGRLVRLDSSLDYPSGFRALPAVLRRVAREALLPRGYPHTVSEDYTTYQFWDTVQAAASTVGHALSTGAVLRGVGVGDGEASVLGAVVTWLLKDGAGRISSIVFAWAAGSALDSDCKRWRLTADILNDAAMLLEAGLLPFFPGWAFYILCISSSVKAVVGVAGGATRAAVTRHQAVADNTADVAAKDQSQETCVNLVASMVAVGLLSQMTDSVLLVPVFIFITWLHLYANYKAVRSMRLRYLNPERFHLVLSSYLSTGKVTRPEEVCAQESVMPFSSLSDRVLTGLRVETGSSLGGLGLTPNQLRMISSLYKDRKFMLVQSTVCVRAALSPDHTVHHLFQAYFHALVLALASSRSPLVAHRLSRLGTSGKLLNIEQLIEVDRFSTQEFQGFWNGLFAAGWNLKSHQLHSVDAGWRSSWASSLKPHMTPL